MPLHFTMFNSKVRLMNQSNSKDLVLSAQEARNLHADIFELLNQYNTLNKHLRAEPAVDVITLNMDGGKF